MGRVILNASETWTGTVHFKCVWSCLQMFFCFFCFLYIYLMHWSDPRRHLCCLDTQYVMDAGKLFFSFVFVHVHKDVSPHPSCIFFLEQSLLPLHTFCILLFSFKSSSSHQIKFLMARHPFKNPLKALVTFQATCFCVFFIHLIQKKKKKLTKHQLL